MKFLVVLAAIAGVAVGLTPFTTVWTVDEISMALHNPDTHPAVIPYLEDALNHMMEALFSGEHMQSIALTLPTVTTFTLQELSDALQDPTTDPAAIPYLENALNHMMTAIHQGIDMETITVVIPPPKPAPEAPVSVPGEVELPAAAAASPLVKIIVNVNQPQNVQTPPVLGDFAVGAMARNQ